MPTIFVLFQLKDGVDPDEYDRFIREVDYPISRSVPSIISYRSYRIQGPYRQAEIPYQYIEVIEVNDLETYRNEQNELPQVDRLRQQILKYIEPAQSYWAEPVEEI